MTFRGLWRERAALREPRPRLAEAPFPPGSRTRAHPREGTPSAVMQSGAKRVGHPSLVPSFGAWMERLDLNEAVGHTGLDQEQALRVGPRDVRTLVRRKRSPGDPMNSPCRPAVQGPLRRRSAADRSASAWRPQTSPPGARTEQHRGRATTNVLSSGRNTTWACSDVGERSDGHPVGPWGRYRWRGQVRLPHRADEAA